MNPYAKLATSMLVALSLAACGGNAPDESATPPADEQTQTAEQTESAPAAATVANPRAELTVSDIERWQRGMEAEKRAVAQAASQLAEAKDDNAKLEALHAATEMGTLDAGAAAAELDRDQYRRIRTTFSSAVSSLSPIEMEMDVSSMPPQMVEQMQQGRESSVAQLASQIPAEVLDALKSRAAELRKQDKELVAERLKVANAAR